MTVTSSNRLLALYSVSRRYIKSFKQYFFLSEARDQLTRYRAQLKPFALQDSTKKTLMSQFKAYHLFCQFYQFQPLPVTKTTYLNYIAFLSHSLKSYNSIMNYLSVLKHINLTLRYDTTFMDDYDCHMLKKAVKRCVKESVNRKHPITVSILYNCFRLFTSCPLHLCMKALFLVAFFSLLRKSNPVPLTRAQVSSSSGCFFTAARFAFYTRWRCFACF